ncbi:MAG: hypothetical protein P4L46_07585 [Fimbriimonas sp.]|nr:hypothetical protein [Fimbriimonas sp.]
MNSHHSEDDAIHEAILEANQMSDREMLWYRMGALIFTLIIMILVWVLMVGRKEFSPNTAMIWPATSVLDKGIKHGWDIPSLSRELKFPVLVPDLRQLGIKPAKYSTSTFGGNKSAVVLCQYGKSTVLIYRFLAPSKLFNEMKRFQNKNGLYYFTSGDAVSVVVWRDRRVGYYGLAARATERDLLGLADKVVVELRK